SGLLNAGGSYAGTNVLVSIPQTVTSGTYRVFFTTDARNQVYEHTANDNNASAPVTITITQTTADLQVTAVSDPPSTLLSGDQLSVFWTVRNLGISPANSAYWNDRVYLSPDGVLGGGDDVYLGSVQRNGALAPNESYDATRTFTLPAELEGAFRIVVATDFDNRVVEGAFEQNNTAASLNSLIVSLRPAPDLQVTAVAAPTSASAGQPFDLAWTVRNFGPGPANGSWYDSIYLSLDQILDEGDTYLGYSSRPANLAVDASYTRTASLTIPKGQAGLYYVFVAADAGNQINERSRESNNLGYDPVSMQISLLPPADLVVGTIDVPVNGVPGRNITIDYTVENQGENPAQGRWTDSLYLSSDDHWDVGDLLIGRVDVQANVPGGGSYSRSLTAPAPGVNPGLYHVIVRSDILNHLPELNDANNLRASLDRVDMDVEVLELGVPTEYDLASGAAAYYKLDVPAGETVRFVLDSISNDADTEVYVRYGEMASRTKFDFAANEPFHADQTLTIPAEQTGTYYVLVYRRAVSGSQRFSLTANLVPFSISRAASTAGGDSGQFTIKIEGAKFAQGTEFELVAPGIDGEIYGAVRKFVQNSTVAYVTFDLTFA
ncbi:MAG: Na-Ca exchanger/integrin-beta4, partial [Planctomycetaceae bacterium]